MSRSHSLTLALLVVALGSGVASWAAGPADPLLRLVPTDVGLTFALEDLQGHARTTFRTPLIEGLSRLPAVEAWRQSDDFRGMRRSIAKLEAVLGADFARIRDGLLGEAVVLTLRLPAGAGPDAARGLLLARVPDRPLLDRLIRGVNDAQLKEGVLHNVAERKIGEVAYHVREFGGRQPDEYYVVLEGAIFAWSNSEDLVREVIDRREKGGGLGETETFRTIRAGLPERALLSAYVEAGFARRVLAAAPRPDDARGERLAAVVGRYLGAVRYAGAALAWDDGPVLHTHEALDPARLPSAVKKWASRTGAVDPRLSRVSASTFALATIRGDSLALLDLFRALTPEPERPRVENFIVALQGMMLGLDLRDELAPQLGPGWSLAMDVPESGKVPFVLATQVATSPAGIRAASAIENGLRTFLALTTLDAKTAPTAPRLETRRVGSATVTALNVPGGFAFAVHDGRIVVGSTAAAVARALAAQDDPEAGERFRAIRERYAAGAANLALLDLDSVYRFADTHRAGLAQRLLNRAKPESNDAGRDLDQVLELVHLFRAAYLTSTLDPSFTSVHRTLGLVAQPGTAASPR